MAQLVYDSTDGRDELRPPFVYDTETSSWLWKKALSSDGNGVGVRMYSDLCKRVGW